MVTRMDGERMNEQQWLKIRKESGTCIGFSSTAFRSMLSLRSKDGNDLFAFPQTFLEDFSAAHPEIEVNDICYRLQIYQTGIAEHVWFRVFVNGTMIFMECEQLFGPSGKNTVSRFSYHIFDARKREDNTLLSIIARTSRLIHAFVNDEGYFRLNTLYQRAKIGYPPALHPYIEVEGK